jgi:aryl-alcohol dehydrogenase-like predicted oxidoreductase
MKYRFLGSSGLLVSRITLGTMTFGAADWGCDESESHAIMKKYLDAGGNFLDSADVYAGGRAEEEYLTWFNKKNYGRFFSAGKFHDEMTELP